MRKEILKNVSTHLLIILGFILISFIYNNSLLEGKKIVQSDYVNFQGMSKELDDYKEKGVESQWTNSMFGGMPAYLIKSTNKTLFRPIHKLLTFNNLRPVSFVFLYLIGAYIALLLFGANPWLSFLGAIAFTFSSYNFIIIAVGHNTKAMAIGYMFPVIAGVYAAFRGRLFIGSAITGLFLGLQLYVNHLQITYYTLLIIIIFGIVELIYVLKSKKIKHFFKTTLILIIIVILAFSSNIGKMWTTYEYGKYSIRGKSELTKDSENKTKGLDKDYATQWSYGVSETFTFLIPNFKGGPSYGALDEKSATFDFFSKIQGKNYAKQVIKQLPLYWGEQPYTAGPVYLGAIIIFLFVLGIFILDKKLKWWLLSATVLSVLLSWGHNFNFLTNLFLDYFPGYNKFRTVSMILVISQFSIALMAILALKEIINKSIDSKKLENALKYSFYIVGGITLIFILFSGALFDFISFSDQQYISQGAQSFIDALREDRKMLLRKDAFRSFIFIALSFGVLYLFLKNKIKLNYVLVSMCILILIDMWTIDKRYLNDDNFVSKRKAKTPFQITQADKEILKDNDPNFRVLNLSVSTFNDASTSYFHKSIGGYHGAKMKRYQELIEYQISKNNLDVLNMLNTKYFIVPDKNKQPVAQYNPEALGHAWFVENYKIVPDADAEIKALDNFTPSEEAVIDMRFKEYVEGKNFEKDSLSKIKLESYTPNHLTYNTNCKNEKLAVFSEIYYPKGWNAYIDGQLIDHFRVNYILRAMVIPGGEHKIEFKFHPKSYYLGSKISLVSSIFLLILISLVFAKEINVFFKKEKESSK